MFFCLKCLKKQPLDFVTVTMAEENLFFFSFFFYSSRSSLTVSGKSCARLCCALVQGQPQWSDGCWQSGSNQGKRLLRQLKDRLSLLTAPHAPKQKNYKGKTTSWKVIPSLSRQLTELREHLLFKPTPEHKTNAASPRLLLFPFKLRPPLGKWPSYLTLKQHMLKSQ